MADFNEKFETVIGVHEWINLIESCGKTSVRVIVEKQNDVVHLTMENIEGTEKSTREMRKIDEPAQEEHKEKTSSLSKEEINLKWRNKELKMVISKLEKKIDEARNQLFWRQSTLSSSSTLGNPE